MSAIRWMFCASFDRRKGLEARVCRATRDEGDDTATLTEMLGRLGDVLDRRLAPCPKGGFITIASYLLPL